MLTFKIYLEKLQERWWENLLVNEEKLDLKNINPEKPLEELDQESQAKIKQMMYDEQQKRMGLPTSEEQVRIIFELIIIIIFILTVNFILILEKYEHFGTSMER